MLRLTGGDTETAGELTQETFYQAFLGIGRFNYDCSVKTWLMAIAKNQLYTYYRRRKREVPLTAAQDVAAEETPVDRELIRTALTIIAGLPKTTSEIMFLRIGSGLAYAEIAGRLSISEGSARVLYCRGKHELQRKLKEVYHDDLSL